MIPRMPESEIFTLHALHPLVMLAIGGVLVVALIALIAAVVARRSPQKRRQRRSIRQRASVDRAALSDPQDQMLAVGCVTFETTRLLNAEEARLLPILEAATRDFGAGHRLMAQTSLGEILRPCEASGNRGQREAASASIKSKRLDFAIFDRFGHLAAAIEYHGTGHAQSPALLRDAVAREAVQRAGIPYLEVTPDFDVADLRAHLKAILQPLGSQIAS